MKISGLMVALPQWACIHELFAAQVAHTPDAVAVTFQGRSLTYRQLNHRANQLAHCLRRLGVGPDVLVGLCLERSFEMVVGLLGILKAGGAYVPLDPAYPPERLALMLLDARVAVLVTLRRFLERLPELAGWVVCLDAHADAIAQEDQDNPVPRATASDLSCVLYTSGSTGRPKGVMITHRAVTNLLFWMQLTFPMGSADAILQKIPFTLGGSLQEFFAPLSVGARLVAAQPEGHRDCRYLIETICAERISRLKVVPSLLQALLDEPGFDACTSLRCVFCSAEALPRRLLDRFHGV